MAHSSEAAAERVLRGAIARIKPSPEEGRETRAVADEVMRRLRAAIPGDIGIELVGSIAKGTALAGSGDIDIFITFPHGKYTREDLEHTGLAFAKRALAKGETWEIGFAEHPYLKAVIRGKDVEIVPAFKISSASEKASAADRSPLHTEYVLKRISEKQKDDVRMLKKFLKRLAVYGAEVKVEGFSGYLCELLILRHASIQNCFPRRATGTRKPLTWKERTRPRPRHERNSRSRPSSSSTRWMRGETSPPRSPKRRSPSSSSPRARSSPTRRRNTSSRRRGSSRQKT